MRLLLATFLLLALPSGASAAEITLDVEPADVRFGTAHRATGTLTEAGAPLAGQTVMLSARTYPYREAFEPAGETTTGPDGRFVISRRFDRNVQLRASAPVQGVTSPVVRAYVFPRATITFRSLGGDRIRILQTYRVPRGVRFTAPTIFYAGPRNARTGPVIGRAKPRRLSPGRFRATLRYTLPREWNGRFRYGTCFRYSESSGLGDPRAGCPRRFRF
jgi:hypothetical protein